MKLEYITRGMGDPQGKPRVWLSCHPDDYQAVHDWLPADLLRHANCAVWYDAEPGASHDWEALETLLGDMRLMVFGVTTRFLDSPNRAREREMPFALEHNIPILPILLEPGLEWEFNEKCAEVQLVNRHITDPTATPYDEVLETFLGSVLVGDDLAEKVRDAFDAYVFLSYRKKDRRHAQRLMRLIHENERFRDIAIWYDEYLVPGENFNDAIRAAFDKSGLFALAVTPNLLEQGNYVMDVEYPLARDRATQSGDMQIVPVELYETDRNDPRTDKGRLKAAYEDIPPVQDEHDRPRLDEAFVQALGRIARKESDGSARHRFFIGLAYLCGIDMEVDSSRALALITSAAEDPEPCFEATEKLVDMYRIGDGVERNVRKAIQWQRRLCDQYREEYGKGHSPDEHLGFGTKYFRALLGMSDLLREAGDMSEAVSFANQALAVAGELTDEVGVREVQRDTAVICNRLGGLCRAGGDIDRAEEYYRRSLDINARLAREMGTARARRDLSVSQERLGDIYRKRREPDRAEELYNSARVLREELNRAVGDAGARRDLSAILTKLGNIRKARKDLDGAAKYYGAALELDRVLAEENRTWQARDDYAVSLVKLGDVERAREHCREAVERMTEAVEILERNAKETGSLLYRSHLAAGLEKLAKAWDKYGRREPAEDCYRRAVRMREELAEEYPSHSTRHELATACFLLADFSRDAGMMRKAMELWEDMRREHPEYGRYADKAREMISRLT